MLAKNVNYEVRAGFNLVCRIWIYKGKMIIAFFLFIPFITHSYLLSIDISLSKDVICYITSHSVNVNHCKYNYH